MFALLVCQGCPRLTGGVPQCAPATLQDRSSSIYSVSLTQKPPSGQVFPSNPVSLSQKPNSGRVLLLLPFELITDTPLREIFLSNKLTTHEDLSSLTSQLFGSFNTCCSIQDLCSRHHIYQYVVPTNTLHASLYSRLI